MVNGDVIIGRILHATETLASESSTIPAEERQVRKDRSVILSCEPSERWVVDRVMISITKEGHRMVRVKLRSVRIPQEGDKISSRHGQKGTIGVLMNDEDLPFVMAGNNAGMRPDAIINLHSINGRMTIGKLLEMLFSSLGLVEGNFVDATPFRAVNARWAMEKLLQSGYGTEERMIDGTTGRMMDRPWFIGSCFYQTLKHMVLDKITVRQRGQRAILTRQPLDGRANQGGQRMGEMEKDAFLAHGAAYSLDDRSRIASDAHVALVCSKCGQIGDSKEETLRTMTDEAEPCRVCGAHEMVTLPTTYCYSRLLVPELATVGVKIVHQFNGLSSAVENLMLED
jgi:DNA-directed RNA polymerase beta subunit